MMTIKEFEIQLALGTLSAGQKWELANNPNTPVDILTLLSNDKSWFVKSWAAKNPNTPIDMLTILSKDEDDYVRCCANRNPKLRKLL